MYYEWKELIIFNSSNDPLQNIILQIIIPYIPTIPVNNAVYCSKSLLLDANPFMKQYLF